MVAFIAANTGMRLGEILGLTWNDVDFKDNTVNVNKQWKILKNGKSGFGPVKSKNSNRIIPISKNVKNELKNYKKIILLIFTIGLLLSVLIVLIII
nr:site-specific integrase [Clostridium botulinum]